MSLARLLPQSDVLGSCMKGVTLKLGNAFFAQTSIWREHAITFGILGIGAAITPPLSAVLAQWTGVVLNCTQSLLIFGAAATVKTMSIACERFIFLKTVEDHHEARRLYDIQLRPLHIYYTKQPETFYELSLQTQTILNQRFSANGFSCIPYKTFSSIGNDFMKEEVEYLASKIDLAKFSQEKRKKLVLLLFESHVEPIKCKTQADYSLIRIHDLTAVEIANLSINQLRWLLLAITTTQVVPKDSQAFATLTQAFFDAKLPAPDRRFYLKLDKHPHPTSLDPIPENETYLISWLQHYYRQHTENWVSLPLMTQLHLNRHFHPPFALFPAAHSFPMGERLIRDFHKFYQDHRTFWHVLSFSVQQQFNQKFIKLNLHPLEYAHTAPLAEIEKVMKFCISFPFLFNQMTEAQRRMLCNRSRAFLRHNPSLFPFQATWTTMIQEEAEKNSKALARFVKGMVITLVVGGICSFYYVLMYLPPMVTHAESKS